MATTMAPMKSQFRARAAKFATDGSMPSRASRMRRVALQATFATVVPANQINAATATLMP